MLEALSPQIIIAFVFGVTFLIAVIVIAVAFPYPTPFQYNVFRVVLSLAAAGVAAMVPGFININFDATTGLLVRAGGALGVFVVAFFFNPAQLATQWQIVADRSLPPPPDVLPDGQPFPADQREAFKSVWRSLSALELAGRALWRGVSSRSVSDFAEKLREAEACVGEHALFFSHSDYEQIRDILRAADFYLGGKATLLDIYNGQGDEGEIVDLGLNKEIQNQIQQNRRWLTKYQNLLSIIRSSLYNQVAA